MGYRIKELRKNLNMTQEELAQKAGVSRATVNDIETDPKKKMTLRTLEKLAAALGVSMDRIFFDESV